MQRVNDHQMFYFPREAVEDGTVRFSREEGRHIAGSLRLAAGSTVRATDGAGRLYDLRVERVGRGAVVARVIAAIEVPAPVPRVTLFQGVVRPQRMDQLVEKSAELGCNAIAPVECARCVRRAAAPRLERWRRIASEAMKQSRRAYLMQILEPLDFDRALALASECEALLVASEAAEALPLSRAAVSLPPAVALWVGPEGGFAPAEMDALTAAGATAFSLGRYRLRSETAAIAALAALGVLSS